MHAVIYANREAGNTLYERTSDFPAAAAKPVYEFCVRQDTSSSVPHYTAVFAYQPLGGNYLLTVIYRMKRGNDKELRGHVICVNFLMNEREADHFFRLPFPQTMEQVEKTARKLLEERYDVIPIDLCKEFLQRRPEEASLCRSDTPLAALMMGASYCLERKLSKQLYLQSGRPAVEELSNLLRILPPPLRKELRFHTGCVSAAECWNLGICYCWEKQLEAILASDFSKGPDTTKFWYFADGSNREGRIDIRNRTLVNRLIQLHERIPMYDLLRNAVTDWDTYRELSLLLAEDRTDLEEVLRLLPEADLVNILRYANEQEVKQIAKAAPKGSAVRKAARTLGGKTKRQSSSDRFRRALDGVRKHGCWIGLMACLVVSVWTCSAFLEGAGNDLNRKGLCIAGIFGTGFFLGAILEQSRQQRNKGKQ